MKVEQKRQQLVGCMLEGSGCLSLVLQAGRTAALTLLGSVTEVRVFVRAVCV